MSESLWVSFPNYRRTPLTDVARHADSFPVVCSATDSGKRQRTASEDEEHRLQENIAALNSDDVSLLVPKCRVGAGSHCALVMRRVTRSHARKYPHCNEKKSLTQ